MVQALTENAKRNSKEASTMGMSLAIFYVERRQSEMKRTNLVSSIFPPTHFLREKPWGRGWKRTGYFGYSASGNSNLTTYISFLTRRFTKTTGFEPES